MRVDFTESGIYLPEIDLWLDNTQPCDATWISHAHSDHARGNHRLAIGTPATLRLYQMRVYVPENGISPQMLTLEFGEGIRWNGATLSAYPASHILGAAQLLVEFRGERLVYTGDIKLRPGLAGAGTQVIACDHLIIESTFGLPIYKFVSREQAQARIIGFARECFALGQIPAFTGYALGRGQEIVHVLTNAGFQVAVHGAIARYIPVYEEHGFQFPGWEPYDAKNIAGKALVVVPGHTEVLKASGRNLREAYVSGWAAVDNARTRGGAEELIPYSDHADFDELLALVEQSGAKHVDVVHGYTEAFAHILQTRGISAAAPERTSERSGVEDEG